MTGEWPEHEIDHIDGHRTNNRWENLRHVSRAVNAQNVRFAQCNNYSSGLLGVSRNGKNWLARLSLAGRQVNLGTYSTPEAAHEAYLTAKRDMHEGCTL